MECAEHSHCSARSRRRVPAVWQPNRMNCGAVRCITATALPRKHSFDASQAAIRSEFMGRTRRKRRTQAGMSGKAVDRHDGEDRRTPLTTLACVATIVHRCQGTTRRRTRWRGLARSAIGGRGRHFELSKGVSWLRATKCLRARSRSSTTR